MAYGLETLKASGVVQLTGSSSTAIILDSITVTGKTAATVGDPAGWVTYTIPQTIPSNNKMFAIMEPLLTTNDPFSGSCQVLSLTQFRYRIDIAGPTDETVITWGMTI